MEINILNKDRFEELVKTIDDREAIIEQLEVDFLDGNIKRTSIGEFNFTFVSFDENSIDVTIH